MSPSTRFLSSSVGTKLLIGITGVALALFLVSHVAGNLLILKSNDAFNHYSHTLISNPLIPIIEIGLLLIALTHATKAVGNYLDNRKARPVGYATVKSKGGPSRRSVASLTMVFSGLWLALFVVIHLVQFKYGTHYASAEPGVRDLARLEYETFQQPLVVAFYAISMLVVGSHLWHGIASSLQSLGVSHPAWTPRITLIGKVLATLIACGFLIVLLAVAFGAKG